MYLSFACYDAIHILVPNDNVVDCIYIGVAPITQLRTCIIKSNIQGRSPNVVKVILRTCIIKSNIQWRFIFILFIQYFKRVSLLAKLASLPSGPL